jgi:hypothetical protein
MPDGGDGKKMVSLRLDEHSRQCLECLSERYNITQTAALEAAVALLARPTQDERADRVLGLSATQEVPIARIHQHLEAWATGLADATLDNENLFSRQEWNLIADVCNGTLWQGSGSSPGILLAANVGDGHRLDGAGEKWLGYPAAGKVALLTSKVRDLDYLHAWAVITAVQVFWDHCNEIDHSEDEWWTLRFRTTHSSTMEKEKDTP